MTKLHSCFKFSLFSSPTHPPLSPRTMKLFSLCSLPSRLLSSIASSSSNPCSWQEGITCSPTNKDISLFLPNTFLNLLARYLFYHFSPNISGIIPHSLSSLSSLLQAPFLLPCAAFYLQILFLYDNLLNGSIPFSVWFVSFSLTISNWRSNSTPAWPIDQPDHIGAAATGLSSPIPAEIGNLIKLETLALYDTEISGSSPPELCACLELSNLYLHMNKLTGSVPLELAPSEQPTMKELVTLLKEEKSPLEEMGETSQQPLIKPVRGGSEEKVVSL